MVVRVLSITTSIICLGLSLAFAGLDTPYPSVVLSLIGAVLASVGLSQLLAGKINQMAIWLVFALTIIVRFIVLSSIPVREISILIDYVQVIVIGLAIGIPITNRHRNRSKAGEATSADQQTKE